jgi:SepF-like predicted cell division protein (DUF552 family)
LSRPEGTIEKIVRSKDTQVSSVNNNKSLYHSKIYLKAMPLRKLEDLDEIKNEIKSGNILIIKVSPLADKSVEDIKTAVNELCKFAEEVTGDIARLGEERIVVTPAGVRIWREKISSHQEDEVTVA